MLLTRSVVVRHEAAGHNSYSLLERAEKRSDHLQRIKLSTAFSIFFLHRQSRCANLEGFEMVLLGPRRRSQSASPNLSLLTRRKWDSDLAHTDALYFNSLLLADVTSLFSLLHPRLKDLFFWCTAKQQIRA